MEDVKFGGTRPSWVPRGADDPFLAESGTLLGMCSAWISYSSIAIQYSYTYASCREAERRNSETGAWPQHMQTGGALTRTPLFRMRRKHVLLDSRMPLSSK
jgi:hypothetical protein